MRRLLLALAGLGLSAAALAQNPSALRLGPTDARPQIDGVLDEPIWQRAPIYERFVQYLPESAATVGWRTTVQVLVSDDALIFGIRAYDEDAGQIRAPLSRRDQVRRDQDFVSVVIDPVGLRRSAQFVRINAAGVLADGVFTAEDDSEDFAPDFELQAAARRLPDGYSVELRWPLAALRFPFEGGAPWRLMVTRNVPREASHLLVSAPLNTDALSFIAELQVLEGLGDLAALARERSFVALRPELTWRRGQRPSLGTELKWRPRADWVLDASLNPDFSQVELDQPQLAGNTRYALSVPEKRPFFLESTDIAGSSLPDADGSTRQLAAFYSRAIADPDWGLRATWRGPQAQATLMQLRDAGGGQVLRGHAYGTDSYAQAVPSLASFARWRLHLEQASLGALVSRRSYGAGLGNTVLGAESAWHAGEEDLLRGQLLLSRSDLAFDAQGQVRAQAAQAGHRLWLGWQRRNEQWHHSAQFEHISAGFANDNGFVPQAGIARLDLQLNRRLGAQPGLLLASYETEFQLKLLQTQSLDDPAHQLRSGEVLERRVQPGFWFTAARNSEFWGHLGMDAQRARQGGTLHPLRTLTLGFGANPTPWLTWLEAEMEWGRRLDVEADRTGRGAWLRLEAKLRGELPWLGWLEFEQLVEQGFVRNPTGGRAFSDLALQSLVVLHLSARDSLRLVSQDGRFQRRAEADWEGTRRGDRLFSLVYQHRQGLARALSLGLNRARGWPWGSRQTELFTKLVFGFA